MFEPLTSGRVAIVGAGGFGREVLDVVEAVNSDGGTIEFVGFFDDGPVDLARIERRSASLRGGTEALAQHGARYVVAIGSGATRRALVARFDQQALDGAVLVHPAATIGGDTELGPGTIVTAGSRVTTNVRIGGHAQLHVNSTVGHDVTLGDFVSVYPGATISGDVELGNGATVGCGANVLPGVTIGENAYIGAGAVVTRDVAPRVTVVGAPAAPLVDAPPTGDVRRRR